MHAPFQIATRIHYTLLKVLGEGIEIDRMLKDTRYARDVLLVCDAIEHRDLKSLAQRFRAAIAPAPAPQAAAWAADSSGFGMTQPPISMLPEAAETDDDGATPSGWLASTFRRMGL